MGHGGDTFPAPILAGFRTSLALDVAEYQLVEDAWGEVRRSDRIRAGSFTSIGASYGVQPMQSGLWGLLPLNADINWQHETTDGEAPIMPLSDFNAATGFAERPTFRPPVAPGLTPAPQTKVAEGDRVFIFHHQAGESVDRSVVTALPPPPTPENRVPLFGSAPTVPVNRVLEARQTHAEDTGYLLRFYVPGNPFSRMDVTLRFYFGGPLSEAGHGQFCVAFGGSGLAWLYEYVNAAWQLRDEWRFCNPQDAINVQHVLRIIPHGGEFIEFQSQLADVAPAFFGSKFPSTVAPRPRAQSAHSHEIPAASIAARDSARRGWVTGAGTPRWDLRQGLAAQFQVARLQYAPAGLIIDYSVNLPWGVAAQTYSMGQPITCRVDQAPDASGATGVTLRLYDAATGLELTSPGAGQYSAPGGSNAIVPRLDLSTTDVYRSPWLRGYSLSRPSVTLLSAPGENLSPSLHRISITGPDTDPSHETASFQVRDVFNRTPELALRGSVPVAIRAVIDEAEEITLFRGYTEHSPGRRRHSVNELSTGVPWFDYDVQATGMWARLARAYWTTREQFSSDPSYPTSANLPWKVTDACRRALGMAGFPDLQIDMPDHPMRFWASFEKGQHRNDAAWMPQPGSSIGPWVVQMLWDYLGATLIPDPNAGVLLDDHPIGMWRVRMQPTSGATPVFHFILENYPAPATPTLAHMLGAYPEATAWVQKGTFVVWTDPPEANAVLVCGFGGAEAAKGTGLQVRAWAINTNSVAVPAFGTTPPPGHPDTLPGFFPILDVVEWLPAGDEGFRAAAWRCRRLFDVACRAWQGCSFTAPLALISDPDDAHLYGRRRPLRYGDTVTVDGSEYWVRSVSPEWETDALPLARYELQRFNESLPVTL